ncbi:MAG: hypothetical protein ACE5KV_01935 [Thermoplasmata archaeon]
MEEEPQLTEEVETVEEAAAPGGPCPICQAEITGEQARAECDWCGVEFHDQCESRAQTCPKCGRYLPSAKLKALSKDRKYTSMLVVVPFVIIEAVIALISWLTHPSSLSVPDLENWFSIGLLANTLLLVVALLSMGIAAVKGGGAERPKEKGQPEEIAL